MPRTATTPTRTEDPALLGDAEHLQAAIADLVRVYQFRDRDRICCHDVSVTQCYALETLVEHAPLRLSDLAERLFLDKSTTSRVVNALIRKGYVDQKPEAQDRRALSLTPTRAGRQLCSRITVSLVEQQKALLEDMSPEVRAGVIDVIRRLARAADARFRTGISAAGGGSCCGPAAKACE
jgi:MarR family 2-MHQ and catechol resistance regulon transcriptional repressor